MKKIQRHHYLLAAWLVALVGTLGSLYSSEILKFAPCVLCWYQRIFLYPMVFLLPIGYAKRDEDVHWYIAPLAFIGALIAGYHYLLQQGIIPEKLAPCVAGVSCLTKYFTLWGFLTLPLMSFIAFIIILILLLAYAKTRPKFL